MLKRTHVILFSVFLTFLVIQAQPVTALADIPAVGPGVCAWKQSNGQPCNEEFQRCASGCPCYYPKEDGSCGSAQEAATQIAKRDFLYTESEKIYLDILDCLQESGIFTTERTASVQAGAEKCLESGSCTLQSPGPSCSIQDPATVAGQNWQTIKDESAACSCYGKAGREFDSCHAAYTQCQARVSDKVQEAKAANNYAYYDWAVESERQILFAQQEEPTTTGTTTSASQNLEERFQELEKRIKPIALDQAWDIEGKAIDPNVLKGGLSASLPSARVGVSWNEMKADDSTRLVFADGLPLKSAALTTGEPIAKGTESYVTFVHGSTPQLLGTGIPEPDPKRYELKDYIKYDTYLAKEEKHPFKEALFEIAVSNVVSHEFYDSVKMMRWNQRSGAWDFLDYVKTSGCQSGGQCSIIAKSPGTSVFAIVVEKAVPDEPEEEPFPYKLLFIGLGAIIFVLLIIAAIIGGLIYAGYWFGKRKK